MMVWAITEDFRQLKKIMSEIMDDYDAGFNDGRNNLALDLMNHFNKKIKELKEDDNPANNAHIYALESHIEVVENCLKKNS